MTIEEIIEANPILMHLITAHGEGAVQLLNRVMDEYAIHMVFKFALRPFKPEMASMSLSDQIKELFELPAIHIPECCKSYAKQQALAYEKWKWENRWFTFENGYWYYTFEQGTSMSEKNYNKHYRKTPEELYNQFIEPSIIK